MASTAELTVTSISLKEANGKLPVTSVPADFFPSIGDEIIVKWVVDLSGNHGDPSSTAFEIYNAELMIDLAAFVETGRYFHPRGIKPWTGFFAKMPAAPGTIDAVLLTNEESYFGALNGVMSIEVISATQFAASLSFMLTADQGNYFGGQLFKNSARMVKNHVMNATEFNNTFNSVYNNSRSLGAYFYVRQLSENILLDYQFPLRAAWYNEAITVGANGPNWELTRAAVPVTGMSEYADTKIEFTVDDNGHTLNAVRVMLFRKKEGANDLGFVSDLMLEQDAFANVPVGTAPIIGFLKEPSIVTQAAGVITLSCIADKDLLDVGNQYYLAFILFLDIGGGDTISQTFMQPTPIPVTGVPEPVTLSFLDYMGNLRTTIAGKAVACPQERIRYTFQIDVGQYKIDALANNLPSLGFKNDINMIEVSFVDAGTNEVLHQFTSSRVGGGPWSGNILEYFEDASTARYWFTHRIPYFNLQGFPDWTDKTIEIRWRFMFRYFLSFPFNTTVFYNYTQELEVKKYDVLVAAPTRMIQNILFYNPDNGYPLTSLCNLDSVRVRVQLTADWIGQKIKLIPMIDRAAYGLQYFGAAFIQEEDTAPPEFPFANKTEQELSSIIFDADNEFDLVTGQGYFSIDLTQLDDYTQYMVSALAQNKF